MKSVKKIVIGVVVVVVSVIALIYIYFALTAGNH